MAAARSSASGPSTTPSATRVSRRARTAAASSRAPRLQARPVHRPPEPRNGSAASHSSNVRTACRPGRAGPRRAGEPTRRRPPSRCHQQLGHQVGGGQSQLLPQRLQRHAGRHVVLRPPMPVPSQSRLVAARRPPLRVHHPVTDPPPGDRHPHRPQLGGPCVFRRAEIAGGQFLGTDGAAPRRRSGGGCTSSTSIPAAMRCSPGSRSSATSPTRSGSGRPAAAGPPYLPVGEPAPAPPPTRHAAPVAVQRLRRTQRDVDLAVSNQAPRSADRIPATDVCRSTPRKFSATRATAAASARSRPSDCSPRTVTRRPACSSSSPTRIVPAGSVPVTTVPAPRTLKLRSTHSRTSASGSGGGSRSVSRSSSARRWSRSVPNDGQSAREVAASRSCACARRGRDRRGRPC